MENQNTVNATRALLETLAPASIVYFITIVLCLILNAVVLVVLWHQTEIQDHMRVLYTIMATSEMTFCTTWSFWHYFWFTVVSEERCRIISMLFPFAYQVSHQIAMASICGISLNLYILVTRPLRYYTLVTRKRFNMTVACTILVIVLSCGMYLPIAENNIFKLLVHRCLIKEMNAKPNWASTVHTVYQICPACATFALTSAINIKLLVIVRQKTKAVASLETTRRTAVNIIPEGTRLDAGQCNRKAQGVSVRPLRGILVRSRPTWRMKGYITVIIQSASFCALWTPHAIYYSIDIELYYVVILDKIAIGSTYVLPILYMLTNSEARRLCLKFLRGIRIRREKKTFC